MCRGLLEAVRVRPHSCRRLMQASAPGGDGIFIPCAGSIFEKVLVQEKDGGMLQGNPLFFPRCVGKRGVEPSVNQGEVADRVDQAIASGDCRVLVFRRSRQGPVVRPALGITCSMFRLRGTSCDSVRAVRNSPSIPWRMIFRRPAVSDQYIGSARNLSSRA